jgi:hypothetical protein
LGADGFVVFEQIEDEFWRRELMSDLAGPSFFRHSDDDDTSRRYRRYIETSFRETRTAIWCGPGGPHSWRNSNRLHWISALTFKTTAVWKEQVKELVIALKAITSYQCRLIYIKCSSKWIQDLLKIWLRIPAGDRLFNQLHKVNSKKYCVA